MLYLIGVIPVSSISSLLNFLLHLPVFPSNLGPRHVQLLHFTEKRLSKLQELKQWEIN